MGYQLTLTETLLQQLGPAAPAVSTHDWEVGRLVLASDHRSDVDSLRHCLSLAIGLAFEQAQVGHLYATCTHALSRLYRRFAFAAFARDVPLPSRDKVYTLIRGSAEAVSVALSGAQHALRAS